ncbi:thiolase C-terminal domain-containing protein [Parasphingopyxis marina]|uniref:Lipid-transfer protein n=1 Tax=Parasphingopyxis marina TaxID=2761622 RepID=A0A842I168_9SPHN|nr:lipid-transfer protein [Parasphingopyxis marina]MBC2778972.1 lipid-transfer protein [Parasphingopyxis marina]
MTQTTAFKDRTAIVGIGQTAFAKSLPETELQLACRAIRAALDDAGIDPGEVDALGCFTQETTPEFEIARNLGFGELHFFSQVAHGGGAICGAIGQVAMAIALGVAKVGVVWRSRKRGDPSKRQWAGVQPRIDDHWKWSRPHGLSRPVDEVAVMMRRYMHDHGATREQLASVALAQRAYANGNPDALMREKPMTLSSYLDARMISDPLCLFDNCLESDGAIAIVVTAAERVRDLRRSPVLIHAFSQGMTREHQLMTDYHGADPFRSSSGATAANLWRQSDIGPAEIDFAQIYDAFSPLVLFSLENYGFCGRGEAAAFAAGGAIAKGGSLPVNTSGGSLSEVYLHGANLVTEAVRQLRGEAANQVDGAETCLVSTCDSTPNGALVLRR